MDNLNERFGLNGAIHFEPGLGNLTRAAIQTDLASAHIYLHGAHLTHYQPVGHRPVIFLSTKSFFEPGRPIRGGVPVIFPWFGPRNGPDNVTDKSQMHGFVRLRDWTVDSAQRAASGAVQLTLATTSTDATRSTWPHDFSLALTFNIAQSLTMSLAVRNTGPEPLTFEEGLHTYFSVADVRRTTVAGLQSATYRDRTHSEEFVTDPDPLICFPSRTDRLYINTTAATTIDDPGNHRRIRITKTNSSTTVVWNPAQPQPNEFPDIAADDWAKFICVETVNARDNTVSLAPGQSHTMTARIELEVKT